MLVPMLKAINAMIKDSKESEVVCARAVITELIAHYEDPNKIARESMEASDAKMLKEIDPELDPEAAAAQKELNG